MDKGVTYSKAIGIMLMVLGHSRCSVPYLTQTIYMFHMPLFFFLSGYCFNDDYVKDPKKYVARRFKRLWLPYVKYGLLFLLLHNVFFHLCIYSDKCGYNGDVSHLYSYSESFANLLGTFLMTNAEQLLGGYWFLNALFWGSLIAFTFIALSDFFKRKMDLYAFYIDSFAVISMSVAYLLVNHYCHDVSHMQIGARAFVVGIFFYVGKLFSTYNVRPFSSSQICISATIVFVGGFCWYMQIGTLYYNSYKLLPFMATAVMGTWSIYSLGSKMGGGKNI